MSGYLIEKKIILKDVEEISISEEKVLVRGADEIIKEVDKSSFGGGSAISVTKSELDDLISNNSLIPGAYYKVSGVHPTLYDDGTSSGTTIFIKAATPNMLEKNGHGLFYNPKYDQEVDGFGIWGTKSATSGSFDKTNIYSQNDGGFITNSADQSLVSDENGFLYMSELANGRIYKIDPETRQQVVFAENLGGYTPVPLVFANYNNTLYAFNFNFNTIIAIDSDGNKSTFANIGSQMTHMAIDQVQQRIYTWNVNTNNIYMVDNLGEVILFYTSSSAVKWFLIDDFSYELVLTSDGNIVKVLTSTTSDSVCSIPDTGCMQMAVDANNRIFVMSNSGGPKKIHIYDYNTIIEIYSGASLPKHFGCNLKGSTYVTMTYPDFIMKFDKFNQRQDITSTEATNFKNIVFDSQFNMYTNSSNGTILCYQNPYSTILKKISEASTLGQEFASYYRNTAVRVSEDLFYNINMGPSVIKSDNGILSDLLNISDMRFYEILHDANLNVLYAIGCSSSFVGKIYKIDLSNNTYSLFVDNIFVSHSILDSDGNLFVIIGVNGVSHFRKITPAGIVSNFSTALPLQPTSMAFDKDGNLYVCAVGEYVNGAFVKILPDGTMTLWAEPGYFPSTVEIIDDRIYVGNEYGIGYYEFNGTFHNIITNANVGGSNDIKASSIDKNIVYISTPSGLSRLFVDSNTSEYVSQNMYLLIRPRDLFVNSDGSIICVNSSFGFTEVSEGVSKFYEQEFFQTNDESYGSLLNDDINNPSINTADFTINSGTFENTFKITGTSSRAAALVKNIQLNSPYEIGDKTIWGGYSWTNNSGMTGQFYDQFTLSSDWTKDIYDLENYNPSLDIIEYDYVNDWISRRYDSIGNNEVIYLNADYIMDSLYFPGRIVNAISAFQFGNPMKFNSGFFGVWNNKVINSYLEIINFNGTGIYDNTLKNNSRFINNTGYKQLTTIELNYSKISDNEFGEDGAISTIQMFVSSLQNCRLYGLINLKFDSSNIEEIDLSDNMKEINTKTFENANIYGTVFTGDEILFNAPYNTIAYNRPDGIAKIRYYDNDDNLVISDITD